MDINVTFSEDPAWVLSIARELLTSQPVLHNMIHSLLHARIAYREPGRFWVGACGDKIVAVVFQSPLTFAADLTPMDPNVAAAIVDAIADAGIALPGVSGEAATAASFAGQWTERCKSAAIPFQGQRIYEFLDWGDRTAVRGRLRKAISDDRSLMVSWTRAFQDEIGVHLTDPEILVDRWLRAGQLWLWDDGQTMSMAVGREPVAGVVRVSGVYTPPAFRRHGYATACVQGLSESIREAGYRCILYTDLGNPASNSIYRRIGYRAIAEALRYRFE